MNRQKTIELCNSIIMVADKFIAKVADGRARSTKTLSDLIKLKAEAEIIKAQLTSNA